jgi:hypothetical protein
MRTRIFFPVFLVSAIAMGTITACGDDDNTPIGTRDGGSETPEAAPVVPGAGEVKQTGKIVRANETAVLVSGATVTIADKSATTNATGDYEIAVPKGKPVFMTVTAPDYYKLLEQEYVVNADAFERGPTQLLSVELANFLTSFLPNRKAEKGVLVVKINAQAPCTTEEGATVALEPQGESQLRYFNGQLPSSSATSAHGGDSFNAAFYNVEIGVPLKVTVTHPTCAQVAFPVTVGSVTFTGSQKTEAGDALSYMRLYIGASATPSDAGADAPDGG